MLPARVINFIINLVAFNGSIYLYHIQPNSFNRLIPFPLMFILIGGCLYLISILNDTQDKIEILEVLAETMTTFASVMEATLISHRYGLLCDISGWYNRWAKRVIWVILWAMWVFYAVVLFDMNGHSWAGRQFVWYSSTFYQVVVFMLACHYIASWRIARRGMDRKSVTQSKSNRVILFSLLVLIIGCGICEGVFWIEKDYGITSTELLISLFSFLLLLYYYNLAKLVRDTRFHAHDRAQKTSIAKSLPSTAILGPISTSTKDMNNINSVV